ncbi:MAG: hypothetical protein WCL50_02950 [Spirochaetota bacterium]
MLPGDRQEVQQPRRQRQHRDIGVRITAEDRRKNRTVYVVQLRLIRLEAEGQLIEPAQREVFLGRHAQDPHDLPAIGCRVHTHLLDQCRLADAGLPGDHHRTLGVLGQHPRELGQLGLPTHQVAASGHEEIIGGRG